MEELVITVQLPEVCRGDLRHQPPSPPKAYTGRQKAISSPMRDLPHGVTGEPNTEALNPWTPRPYPLRTKSQSDTQRHPPGPRPGGPVQVMWAGSAARPSDPGRQGGGRTAGGRRPRSLSRHTHTLRGTEVARRHSPLQQVISYSGAPTTPPHAPVSRQKPEPLNPPTGRSYRLAEGAVTAGNIGLPVPY